MNKKEWQIKDRMPADARERLAGFSDFQAQLLYNRGISTAENAEKFLHASYAEDKHDPYLLDGLDEAVKLIIDTIKAGEKIVIYGDYDADGVTASAVLFETLKLLKAKAEVYIPDRVTQGYGLNRDALTEIKEAGAHLVITVDNGIRSAKEVEYAKSLGLKVIITDHHIPADDKAEWPQTIIVNPWISTETYPFSALAGVGVAAKVAIAIIYQTKLDDDLKLKLEERILDLVALGTIGDCVPLNGENRLLVKKGLEVINKRKRLGLNELIEVSKLDKTRIIDSWNIGFQLAPRLNAAGRINHANDAFELLTVNDDKRAKVLASELNQSNMTRQQITDEVVKSIIAEYEAGPSKNIIVAVCPDNESWNEGVIGLAAGRVVERYYRPALVITGENGHYKGSGRSIKEFNLIQALTEAGEFLVKFGGHKAACGFSVNGEENLKKFTDKISEIADAKLKDLVLKPSLDADCLLPLIQANEESIAEAEALAPFGEANPKPVFVSTGVKIADLQKMGTEGQHLKLRLQQNESALRTAIGFSVCADWQGLKIGDIIDIAYYLEINEFNGRREPQLKIIDLKRHE